MELDLKVYWHSDDTRVKDEAGLDFKVSECDTRVVTFYEIGAVTKYVDHADGKKEYAWVMAAGDRFICVDSVEVIKEKIRKEKIKILFS